MKEIYFTFLLHEIHCYFKLLFTFDFLLQIDSSDKENSEGNSKEFQDVSRPSPVKQTKTEVERPATVRNKMEDAAKEKSTMSIAKREGILNLPMLPGVPEQGSTGWMFPCPNVWGAELRFESYIRDYFKERSYCQSFLLDVLETQLITISTISK